MPGNDAEAIAFHKDHPYGTAFLGRNNTHSLHLFPDGPFGAVDINPTVCTANGECPYYHNRDDATNEGASQTPIHMLIASFRDRLCPRTLHNVFTRAENPKRMFIRIMEQTLPGSDLIDDVGCWARYCVDYNTDCQVYEKQVRTVHVDSTKSKGPTDARSKLSAMISWDYVHKDDPEQLDFVPVQTQDFCMQTDSHMDFSDNFDTELVFMFHRTETDYAVLSTYVASMEQNNKDIRTVPNLCMVEWTSTIRNWGTKECRHLVRPKMTNAMWGAGLSFHRCHAELNVPVDPYLDNVFDGEEGSRGLRFFTHGYDVYTPDRVLVTHDYKGHQGNPVVHTWGGNRRGQTQEGRQLEDSWKWTKDIEKEKSKLRTCGTPRVNMMLGIGNNVYSAEQEDEQTMIRSSRFGLGTKRTLEQAIEFSGIDLRGRKMAENKCGNLIWVPFDESPDYGVSEIFRRGLVAGGQVESPPAAAAGGGGAAVVGGGANAGVPVLRRAGVASVELKPPSQLTGGIQLTDVRVLSGALLAAIFMIRIVSRRRKSKGDRHND